MSIARHDVGPTRETLLQRWLRFCITVRLRCVLGSLGMTETTTVRKLSNVLQLHNRLLNLRNFRNLCSGEKSQK